MNAYAIFKFLDPIPLAVFKVYGEAILAAQSGVFGGIYVAPYDVPDGVFTPAPPPCPKKPAQIQVSTTSMHFSISGSKPAQAQLTISNSGEEILTWTLTTQGTLPTWVTIDLKQGTLDAGKTSPITLTAKRDYVFPGSYTFSLVLTPNNGPPVTIPVTIDIPLTG